MISLRACMRPAVATLLLTVSLAGCKKKEAARTEAPVDPNTIVITPSLAENVQFGTPAMTEVTGLLQVPARVETDARRIARVGSPVAGRILKLLAFEGQHVRAGTVLATLHSTNLSDTQFALLRSATQRDLDEASERRAQQLVAADVIGRAELERRHAETLQASSEASSYRTQLLGLGMTEGQISRLESSRKLSADYPIVTPKGGIVLKREITVGQVVQPADPAFTIADLSSVWLTANVPEQEAGTLKPGMEVRVMLPALPGKTITGKLSFVAPIVDPATRTVEVRMDYVNGDGALKPDQLASMLFTGRADRKLTIPSTAVVRDENKDYVFLKSGPKSYVLREVQLGEEEHDRRIVLSGLQGNDQIVTDGAFHLNNQRKQNAIKGGE